MTRKINNDSKKIINAICYIPFIQFIAIIIFFFTDTDIRKDANFKKNLKY